MPDDYDSSNPTSPGLIEDPDDDADGIPDTNETDTGSYVDESDTGTSPTNPDSDADGMCDGPNAVSNVCTAGPDAFPLTLLVIPIQTEMANQMCRNLELIHKCSSIGRRFG